jgi:hypothetical protein
MSNLTSTYVRCQCLEAQTESAVTRCGALSRALHNFLNHFFHLKFSRFCGNGVTSTCLICADKLAALDIRHADVEPVTRHLAQTSPLIISNKQSGKY